MDLITDCLGFVREFNQVIQQIQPWYLSAPGASNSAFSDRKVVLSRPLKDLDEVLSDLMEINKKRNDAKFRLYDCWRDLDETRKKIGTLLASLAAITAIQKLVDSVS